MSYRPCVKRAAVTTSRSTAPSKRSGCAAVTRIATIFCGARDVADAGRGSARGAASSRGSAAPSDPWRAVPRLGSRRSVCCGSASTGRDAALPVGTAGGSPRGSPNVIRGSSLGTSGIAGGRGGGSTRVERSRSAADGGLRLRLPNTYRATISAIPAISSIQRSSLIYASHGRHAHGLVNVHGHEPRHAGLVHRHPEQLVRELHRRLVVRDEHELHAARHVPNDVAEAPDVVLVERRVDLVEQAEGRRVEL